MSKKAEKLQDLEKILLNNKSSNIREVYLYVS
jgi:hypothetical protein